MATPTLARTANLPVERVESRSGPVYVAETSFPVHHRHGALALGDVLAIDGAARERLSPGLSVADLAGAAFFDIETTGLAGGTGTLAFLVGIGGFDGDRFRLRQYFLADLRHEGAMLDAVLESLEGSSALVSFNGRRFDLPLLETRFRMARRAAPAVERHIDLLYPARRLYRRRLASCSLGSLESALLGLQRYDDTPGWLIPGLYFDYMRGGRAGALGAVFRHNALDILSLVTLAAHLGHVVGGKVDGDADHCLAVARWDEAEGRLDEAARLYERAWRLSPGGEAGASAVERLARIHRRLGRWEEAERLWWEEEERSPAPGRRLRGLVESAKLAEHRRRDYAAASALTQRALTLLEVQSLRGSGPALAGQRAALEHRLRRLQRRLAASAG